MSQIVRPLQVVHCSEEKSDEYKSELAIYCIKFLHNFEWGKFNHDDANLTYHLSEIIDFALDSAISEIEASELLSRFVNFERSRANGYAHRQGQLLAPFFQHFPKETLDSVFLKDDDGGYWTSLRLVSEWSSEMQQETAIGKVPVNILIEWCEVSPSDRYLFAAQTCTLFKKTKLDDKENLVLSDNAKHIFASAPDKKNIVEIFVSRFQPNGWSGSLADILRKRLPLLDELNLPGNSEIEQVINDAKVYFNNRIDIEEKREEDSERNRTGSFE